jgi:tetratricopeptide (TPR) repeat protein
MKKENTLYAVIGLLLGLIIGFTGANYLNRMGGAPAQSQNGPNGPGVPNSPAGQTAPAQPGGGGAAAIPQVAAALDKAKNEPDNFDAQKQAGMMYYRIQNLEQAQRYLEQANRINPEDYETKVTLGNINFDAGKYDEAEKLYTAALAQKPDDVNVRTDLGLSFFFRQPRDTDRAIAEYRKALQYDPKHELTLQNLCAALKEKGDKEALAEAVKKLEEVNPKNEALAKLKQ